MAESIDQDTAAAFDAGFIAGLRKALKLAQLWAHCQCDTAFTSRGKHELNASHEVAEEIAYAIEREIKAPCD